MAINDIPRTIADFESQLSTAISIGDTTFSLVSAEDDDGIAIPNGKYCFTLDNGTTAKEYLMGNLVGEDVTGVVSISRQGAETTGALRAHRVGASVIITDFATIQRVGDALRGALTLDADSPLSYDVTPTLSDGKQLATVAYVLSIVTGGTVNFSAQTFTATAGETISSRDIVYFKISDGRWWKADANVAATIQDVQLGVAMGSGTAGNGITGGVQVSGPCTGFTGLTAFSTYYLSDTAGGISTTAGTYSVRIGYSYSTTEMLLSIDADGYEFAGAKLQAGYAASTTGNDTYVVTLTPVPSAYVAGMEISFNPDTGNTGAATINVNGLGAKTLKKFGNADLVTGDLVASQIYKAIYDGTNFQLQQRPLSLTIGTASKTTSDANATQTIAHGLGAIPRKVRFDWRYVSGVDGAANNFSSGHGTYCAMGQFCQSQVIQVDDADQSTDLHTSDIAGIILVPIVNGNYLTGTVSVDATNISIAWVKTGTPTAVMSFNWEAQL